MRKVEWTRIAGVVLLLFAIWFALDPRYPVDPADAPILPKPAHPSYARPVAVAPVGACPAPITVFEWTWTGPPVAWELLVLDADLHDVALQRVEGATRWVPDAELLARLASGTPFHWLVRSELGGRRIQSRPSQFWLGR